MPDNWAPQDIRYKHYPNVIYIILTTSTPCHLHCYYTDQLPLRHPKSIILRGLVVPWDTRYCFVSYTPLEQQEAGDTLLHTFNITPWPLLHTKYFTFKGTINSLSSPSIGPIFTYQYPDPMPIDFYTEEQLLHNGQRTMRGSWGAFIGNKRVLQWFRNGIYNRSLSHLSFKLQRFSQLGFLPAGPVFYEIRRWWDKSLIYRQYAFDASILTDTPTWYPLILSDWVHLNEPDVILGLFHGSYSTNAGVSVMLQTTDIKPGEQDGGQYNNNVWFLGSGDLCYIYTYDP